MTKTEIQSQALALMLDEITKDEQGTVWITKNRGLNMRFIWDRVRENYYGIFEKPKDHLGQEKIFYPLTEFLTWENVKNEDVDVKDINIKAKKSGREGAAIELRYKVKDWMTRVDFGEQINKWQHRRALDGHLIVKTFDYWDEETGKQVIKTVPVDLRNCFYDKHAEDLRETPFIERSVQSLSFIQSAYKKQWINIDKINGRTNVAKVNQEHKESEGNTPETELFERWGEISKEWITGKAADKDTFVYARMVASNLRDNGNIHLIKQEQKKNFCYEDSAFEHAPNRHPGRGVGEKVLYLQLYLNTLYNVRRVNNLTLANQLFQFRAGSGVTPDKIRKLVAGGAIEVQNIGDIERIDTRNINFSESLSEEQNLIGTANRVTSSQEAASGEALPSSTPATNAIIQNQSVGQAHDLRRESFGLFLERLFRNQIAPRINKYYENEDEIPMENDEALKQLKPNYANNLAAEAIQPFNEAGQAVDTQAVIAEAQQKVKETKSLYLKNEHQSNDDLEVEFFVTNEGFDKTTLIANLKDVLFNFSQIAGNPDAQPTLRELYDILGLDSNTLIPAVQQTPAQPMQGQPQEAPGAQMPAEKIMASTTNVNNGGFA